MQGKRRYIYLLYMLRHGYGMQGKRRYIYRLYLLRHGYGMQGKIIIGLRIIRASDGKELQRQQKESKRADCRLVTLRQDRDLQALQ